MRGTRPRTVIVSEITQLLLLCEPIWRALQMGSVVSVIGTLAICSIPAAVILLATRKRKIWARDLLSGLAVLSWLFAMGSAVWQREFGIVQGILTTNLAVVALLFTDSANYWFGHNEGELVSSTAISGGENRSRLVKWFNSVDIGVRPRDAFKGADVNLYAFTLRGAKWIEQHLDQFSEPVWSQRKRCLMLSESDSSHIGLVLIVDKLQSAGLTLKFFGRLKGWDGTSPWLGD
jgi:hypothetical protein